MSGLVLRFDPERMSLLDINQLHRDCIVFDAHCDFLFEAVNNGRRFESRFTSRHVDLPRLEEGGVTAQVFALWGVVKDEKGTPQPEPTAEVLRQVEAFFEMLQDNGDRFMSATCAAHVRSAKTEGKVAGILSLEGAEPLVGDIRLLRLLVRLGVRSLGLTWNFRNEAGDGADVAQPRGLTDFGCQLVEECGELGVMVDVAHLAPAGVDDVLRISRRPVIDTHANAFALCPHVRNLADPQMDGIAATGGVVCVTFVPQFVAASPANATLEAVLDHVDYMVKRIGIDHVGLGSDFEGYDGTTTGLEDVTRLPAVTQSLLRRGYGEDHIRKLLGENLLRVFEEVAG